MQKIHFSVRINAPVKTVWHAMLDDKTYREWTQVFAVGSHYVGDWNTGSKILFLGPSEKGMSGMVSRIHENRPYEFLLIEHVGLVQEGKEDMTSDEVKKWSGAFENYTFTEVDGQTEVAVNMDIDDTHKEVFDDLWPKALQKLKEVAESGMSEIR